MPTKSEPLNLLNDLVRQAIRAGADSADAMLGDLSALSVSWRDGKLEALERAESGDLGLRVFIGKKMALVSSTDRDVKNLSALIERAVAMAQNAPEDPFCGIAAPEELAKNWPDIEQADKEDPAAETLIEQAKILEDSVCAVPGVTQCESADVGASRGTVSFVTTQGFAGQTTYTSYSLSTGALAGTGTGMERDYDFATKVFRSDLPSASSIGKKAGERAVARLGAKKMPTVQCPVVFDPRVAKSFLGHLSSALSGSNIARGTSFLKDKLGNRIFPENISIIDDPFLPRGLRSSAFDGEGLTTERRKIVDNGMLTSWFLDLRAARQLQLRSTGHAHRSASGLPSPAPHNFYIESSEISPKDLMADIKQGFYVTDLMGSGANIITGDYSRAAAGFWIENGEICFPVNEMTIAGQLAEMFLHLSVANDLSFAYGIDAPTLRIETMTVAGK